MRKRRKRTAADRAGVATVEFAVCAPLILILGLGMINIGFLVQLKYNSKMIGHLAATEVFKLPTRDTQSVNNIETRFEQLAAEMGYLSFDISISSDAADGVAAVSTSMPVTGNSPMPVNFGSSGSVATVTHVYAPFE